MPRPSLKVERTEEILQATQRCVIRDGINGITLDGIALEAGMRRSLLRHNIGNREQVIEAFLDYFFKKSNEEVALLMTFLPKSGRIPMLLNYLFDDEYADSQLALVAMALTSAAESNDSIRQRLLDWNLDYISLLAEEMQYSYQEASPDACFEVAAGLAGIFFNAESLITLGDNPKVRIASKKAAARLISTLDSQ